MTRFRRVADRWARWLEHVHTDIPLDEVAEFDHADETGEEQDVKHRAWLEQPE